MLNETFSVIFKHCAEVNYVKEKITLYYDASFPRKENGYLIIDDAHTPSRRPCWDDIDSKLFNCALGPNNHRDAQLDVTTEKENSRVKNIFCRGRAEELRSKVNNYYAQDIHRHDYSLSSE